MVQWLALTNAESEAGGSRHVQVKDFYRMGVLSQLTRRKQVQSALLERSQLAKVLTTFDLTLLGIASTLGVGVFVLPGVVAKDLAGPGGIISFFIAAVTSIFAGLCYAEFGARVPKAGSAYVYSYVTVGEFVAFIIGWTLIIEYIIGAASVARGLSVYLDAMMNKSMESFYRSLFEIHVSFLSEYFDIFAFVISFLVTVGLATGLKESISFNNLLTMINVTIVIFVIIVGSMHSDIKNWQLTNVPRDAGAGGFFPFGAIGTIKAASTCFFGYVGFDCISASGEEVRNPQRSIPIAIILSLSVVCLAYFGVSSVLTLMWPYYLQDSEAPFPHVFEEIGLPWAKWIVSFGGIFGLLASLIAGTFPLPRIIYAMSQDGLLFKFLGKVHPTYRTPFVGTILAGLITGIMASIFNLIQLVDLMAIATLLCYTIVAACVLILRYQYEEVDAPEVSHRFVEHTHLLSKRVKVTFCSVLGQTCNPRLVDSPSGITSAVVIIQTVIFSCLSILLSWWFNTWEEELFQGDMFPVIVASLILTVMGLSLTSITMQPTNNQRLDFKVPWVPTIPALSIFINIYLMMLMDQHTWIRFGGWLLAGLFIYFGYGLFHSTERRKYQNVNYNIGKSEGETSEYEEIKPSAPPLRTIVE